MKRILLFAALAAFAFPSVGAAQYSARLQPSRSGATGRTPDAVELEDASRHIVVSIAPSAGNLTRTMTVNGRNILGPLGKGLRVALTVLDFGRTTFGACCTGAAKTCLQMAVEHGIPVPALSTSLAYFDSYRSAVLPQNLTQAQRDLFGAHTYQRVDRPEAGFVHTYWPALFASAATEAKP